MKRKIVNKVHKKIHHTSASSHNKKHRHMVHKHSLERGFQKKYLMIALTIGVIGLLCLVVFTFFPAIIPKENQANENNPLSHAEVKSYDAMINSGDIEPAKKILEIGVEYNEQSAPQLRFTNFAQKNGYASKSLPGEETHKVQILSQNGTVLSEWPFSIPNTFYSENLDYANEQNNVVKLPQVSFAFTLPWFDTAASVRIVDQKGGVVISSPLTNMQIINNKPNFQGIFPKQAPKPTAQKINMFKNFLIRPSFAQGAVAKKLTIAVLSDGYTDQNKFNTDFQARWVDFFSFEPFKTRQSQIQIFSVWNTTPLQCGFNTNYPGQKLLACNLQLATQQLNSNGAPHDVFVIMHQGTDPDPLIRGSAYQYYSTTQKGIVVTNATTPIRVHEFVHELGHAFGYLMDEYVFNHSDGDIINSPARVTGLDPATGSILSYMKDDSNCYSGTPPAKEWDGLVKQLEYYKGCTFQNWFSPSWDSLMHDAMVDAEGAGVIPSANVAYGKKFLCFNKVSQQILNKRLDAIAGPFPGGDVPFAACPIGGYCQADVLRKDASFQQNRSQICANISGSATTLVNNGQCQSTDQATQVVTQLCNEPAPTAATTPQPTVQVAYCTGAGITQDPTFAPNKAQVCGAIPANAKVLVDSKKCTNQADAEAALQEACGTPQPTTAINAIPSATTLSACGTTGTCPNSLNTATTPTVGPSANAGQGLSILQMIINFFIQLAQLIITAVKK